MPGDLNSGGRELLRGLFAAALAAADPQQRVPAHLPPPPAGRTVVVGAGKASAAMARALERHWHGPIEGLVVTRYGYAVPCQRIEIVEAAHPVPDQAGLAATRRILDLVAGLDEQDLVIALISGGGSALLAAPADGITLADKQAVTEQLLRCGAAIDEINTVRKHLSAVKGGRLAAAAYPARTVGLLISDVPGDSPAVIASGPTVGEASTPEQALEILSRWQVVVPAAVAGLLQRSAGCPRPDDRRLSRTRNTVIAAPQQSLQAAADRAEQAGVRAVILGDAIEGEAREVARVMAGIARQVRRHGQPAPPPCVLLSGGETTVTVTGQGVGGRNVEFLLALAHALDGEPGVQALAADTDGVDGAAEVAGAWIGPDTLARAGTLGLSAAQALAAHDAHTFFAALGDQLVTGPTYTNVNDFRAILVSE